jgi:hypothetical protein
VTVLLLACAGRSHAVYDPTEDVMTVTVEFKTTDVVFAEGSPYPFTPLVTYRGSTYLVWVNASLYPMVAKITGGVASTARLDPDDSYTVMDDGHHRFSLGIDKDG